MMRVIGSMSVKGKERGGGGERVGSSPGQKRWRWREKRGSMARPNVSQRHGTPSA